MGKQKTWSIQFNTSILLRLLAKPFQVYVSTKDVKCERIFHGQERADESTLSLVKITYSYPIWKEKGCCGRQLPGNHCMHIVYHLPAFHSICVVLLSNPSCCLLAVPLCCYVQPGTFHEAISVKPSRWRVPLTWYFQLLRRRLLFVNHLHPLFYKINP